MPIIAFGIYSYFDSIKYAWSSDEEYTYAEGIAKSFKHFFLYIVQGAVFVPALFSIVIGANMMAKSSKWGKFNDEPTLFTLKSISPMINPITRTYGISMGFSF
jgi:hypothetical protein